MDEESTTGAKDFYESFICTLKYNEISVQDGPRYYREIFGYGYRGSSFLHDAKGQHGSLNANEHTDFSPWRLDLRRGKLTTDEASNTGMERCTFKRNFKSPDSFIQLKAGQAIKVLTGYKMYVTSAYTEPKYKGMSGDDYMEWTILEGAVAGLSATIVFAVATAVLYF